MPGRYTLEICFGSGLGLRWVELAGDYATADDAHYAAAQWRSQYGRPTHLGDPFRVVREPADDLSDVPASMLAEPRTLATDRPREI